MFVYWGLGVAFKGVFGAFGFASNIVKMYPEFSIPFELASIFVKSVRCIRGAGCD